MCEAPIRLPVFEDRAADIVLGLGKISNRGIGARRRRVGWVRLNIDLDRFVVIERAAALLDDGRGEPRLLRRDGADAYVNRYRIPRLEGLAKPPPIRRRLTKAC